MRLNLRSGCVAVAAGVAVFATGAGTATGHAEEQDAGYLFRYFGDSDDVHVWSQFGNYDVGLESGARLSVRWNREVVVIPGVDAPVGSVEAVDAVTSASRPILGSDDAFKDFAKVRNEVTGKVGYRRSTFAYYVSHESDYFAQQVSASYNHDFMRENLNLSAGTSYGWDVIDPLADDDTDGARDTKRSMHWNLVATQVIGRTTVVRLGGELTLVNGLQHNLYRRVRAGDGTAVERHPDHRSRRDLFVKLNQYLPNRSSIRLHYRYYEDDWGIRSHTLGTKLSQYITERLVARYRYRHYRQNDATFFREDYASADGIDGYRTGDYRLAAMTSHLFGTRLDMNLSLLAARWPALERTAIMFSYERYFNSNNFSANVFESGLTLRF